MDKKKVTDLIYALDKHRFRGGDIFIGEDIDLPPSNSGVVGLSYTTILKGDKFNVEVIERFGGSSFYRLKKQKGVCFELKGYKHSGEFLPVDEHIKSLLSTDITETKNNVITF